MRLERNALALGLAVCLAISFLFLTGCGEDIHDYSVLQQGDIPRPEYEFVLDLKYWLGSFGIDLPENPVIWEQLSKQGLLDLERTNLIAYERDNHIAIECQYKLKGAGGTIISRVLGVQPPESRLLGRLDPELAIMSLYFSSGREFAKTMAKMLTDPVAVDFVFQGDKWAAKQTKSVVMFQLGMLEGAFFRFFDDECMLGFFENPEFPGGEYPMPFDVVLIAPTKDGEPVAVDIANFILSFGYLISLFIEDINQDDVIKFKEAELAGYPCVYLDIDQLEPIGMVDADGYFFLGRLKGIENAIDAFNRREVTYDSASAANVYCYFNYNLMTNSVLIPTYETYLVGDAQNQSNLLLDPGMLKDFGEAMILGMLDLTENADSTVWCDFAIRFTVDGLDIKLRMQTDLAELNLGNAGVIQEGMEEGFRYLLGLTEDEECPPGEAGEEHPGAVF